MNCTKSRYTPSRNITVTVVIISIPGLTSANRINAVLLKIRALDAHLT